jgi:multiple sugar transport system ATP-binding protein
VAELTLQNVNKVYPNGFHAVHDLDLKIDDTEFLVLVGPSGCGKSTVLRMVAGLEGITSGELHIGDRLVNDVHPKDRDIAMVFQNYALYPHMSVYQNIGFSLKLARTPKAEADRRILDTARVLELEDYLDRKPGELSGGQRQRVAMGRAIVRQPSVFLMDEPLSNLDAKLRVHMRAEISRLQRDLRVTTMYVTHDQVEAMTMGDRVAVLKDGFLQQVDSPQSLYQRPSNVFVAAFIGSPSMNLYEASLAGGILTLGGQTLTLPKPTVAARPTLSGDARRDLIVGIRPEDLEDAAIEPAAPEARLTSTVSLVEALGSELIVHFRLDAPGVDTGDPDAATGINGRANAIGRFHPRSQVKAGDQFDVAVNVENLHFFDPATREAI